MTREFPSAIYSPNYYLIHKKNEIQEPRPWNVLNLVRSYMPNGASVLDAGCGNAKQFEDLKENLLEPIKQFTGFDINRTLLEQASTKAKGVNVNLVQADILPASGAFPFANESFDMITFILSKHNAGEAYRILRPNGVVIMERVGEMDKRNIKLMFGNDEQGEQRGYMSEYHPGDLAKIYKADFIKSGFGEVDCIQATWKTWVTRSGLIALFENTPFVNKFDRKKDRKTLDEVVEKYKKSNGIEFIQHRILIVAKKTILNA